MAWRDAEFVEEECMVCSDTRNSQFNRRILEGVDFRFIIFFGFISLWFLGEGWGVADLELDRFQSAYGQDDGRVRMR